MKVTLTENQWLIARALLIDGASNKLVAERMFVAEDTIKTHMKKLFTKGGAITRTELAIKVWSGQVDFVNSRRGSLLDALRELTSA